MKIVVANAGSGSAGPFHLTTLDDWNSVVATNLTGAFLNVVRPSVVPTDISAGLTGAPDIVDDDLEQMPLHRLGTTDDIASLVRSLAGPESSWITGMCIRADGGHHLRRSPNLHGVMELLFGDQLASPGPPTA